MIISYNVEIPRASGRCSDITESPIFSDLQEFAMCDSKTCRVEFPSTFKNARSAQTSYNTLAKKYFPHIKVMSRGDKLYFEKVFDDSSKEG